MNYRGEKMATENKEMKLQNTDEAYRYQSGKCLITLKFSKGETAPTVEEALEKILMGRLD